MRLKRKGIFPLKIFTKDIAWLSNLEMSDFFSTIKQSMFALITCAFVGIIAGMYLTSMVDFLVILPGLLTMVPATIDMRGNIYASMGSRISTGLHTGEITPTLRRSKLVPENVYSTLIQTVVMAIAIAFFAMVIGLIIGMETIGFMHLFFISLFGSLIAGIGLTITTIFISIYSFKKGLNPDNVTTPVITSIGDILNVLSLFAVGIISLSLSREFMNFSSLIIGVLIVVFSIYSLRNSDYGKKIVKDSVAILAFCAFLGTLAGVLLDDNLAFIDVFPLLLVLTPLFNGTNGNIGGILSARISTSFHLGQAEITLLPQKEMLKEFSYVFVLYVLLFPLLAVLAFVMSIVINIPHMEFFDVFKITILVAVLSSVVTMLSSYYLTYFSVRTKIDPDNVVIPIVTSVMDIASVYILLVVAAFVLF